MRLGTSWKTEKGNEGEKRRRSESKVEQKKRRSQEKKAKTVILRKDESHDGIKV